jgi:hypothetical protein
LFLCCKAKEGSSFFEKKEAKKLLFPAPHQRCARGGTSRSAAPEIKVFLLLFLQKKKNLLFLKKKKQKNF